jgi:hypothetical protein
MAKNRSARAQARKSAPVAIVNDPNALAQERALSADAMLAEAETIIAQDDPTTPDETPAPDREIDAEAVENNPDVIDSTESYTDPAPVEVGTSEGAEEAADKVADPTDGGRMLASRFETSDEALAYAGNMKLRNYSISRQDDGQYAIAIRKQASNKPAAPQTTEGAVQAPARAAPKPRTPRAKASGPRPDTRNAVIWSMLTRPEGTTRKEVDAALAAFQPDNIQPCGIGSDAKLFAGRFGYNWKKTSDADGATRYFCFPFAAAESEASEGEVVEDAAAAEASETEGAAS